MEAKEVTDILQHYRHHLLNELQIIQGYVKLGNTEKADMYLNKLFTHFHHERNFLNLNIPHVFLWFFETKMKYRHFQFSYTIATETKKLTHADMYMKRKLEQIMENIERRCKEDKLYAVHLELKDDKERVLIQISVDSDPDLTNEADFPLEEVTITDTTTKRIYSFIVDID